MWNKFEYYMNDFLKNSPRTFYENLQFIIFWLYKTYFIAFVNIYNGLLLNVQNT